MEPNHTEFIFVDDNSVRKYGGEIAFRAKLEQAISGGFFASKPTTNPTGTYTSLQATTSLRADSSRKSHLLLIVIEFLF